MSGHAKMPSASHQVIVTPLKLLIQQIHPHVRVERDSGMCVARDLYELWGRSRYTRMFVIQQNSPPRLIWWWWWYLPASPLPVRFSNFFRNTQRCRRGFKNASAPPHSYGQRLELVEGTSPRELTCHCSHKAGNIYSSPLYICRAVLLLLRQHRGAAGLGESQ